MAKKERHSCPSTFVPWRFSDRSEFPASISQCQTVKAFAAEGQTVIENSNFLGKRNERKVNIYSDQLCLLFDGLHLMLTTTTTNQIGGHNRSENNGQIYCE